MNFIKFSDYSKYLGFTKKKNLFCRSDKRGFAGKCSIGDSNPGHLD